MRLSSDSISKVNASFIAWGLYTMQEHDETLAMGRTYEFINNGRKPKNAAPRARRYAKWIKSSSTRNRPESAVFNYKPNPSMGLICEAIENHLTEKYQRMLVYKYILGYNNSEIGKELDMSESTVQNSFSDLYLYFTGLLRLQTKIA